MGSDGAGSTTSSIVPPGEQASLRQDGSPVSDLASARRLQILATEHWSLLATRSLGYSESLSRVSMFLSVVSAAVVALALLAQVDRFHESVVVAAVLILSVVLFIGVATIVRLAALNREDFRSVMGMNRIRRGYLDMHPELTPYFLTGTSDDLRGVMLTLDMNMIPGRWSVGELAHGFEALPAMLGVVVGVVAAVLGAVVAGSYGVGTPVVVAVAAGVFLVVLFVLGLWNRFAFSAFVKTMPTRFPSTESALPHS